MRTGWLAIIVGTCFAGAIVPFLAVEGLFLSSPTARANTLKVVRATDKTEPERDEPLDGQSSSEYVALLDDVSRLVEPSIRAPSARKLAAAPYEQTAAEDPGAVPWPTRLERVVAEARCVARSLGIMAPLVQSHAPPAVAQSRAARSA